jgi:predicted dehydrogenase
VTLRIIHVGVGGWGLDWEQRVLPRVNTVERVAAVDASPEILKTAQESLGVPKSVCFTSLSEAVNAVEADAVLVTVPMKFHIPVALEALELGLHALVEKPFAPTVDEARTAVDLAEAKGLTLAVSQNYRFFPAPQAVREIVQSGELGEVGTVHVDFRKHVTREGGGHRHFTLLDPLLVDMAIHHFDLMRFVLGQEPTGITCRAWNPVWSPFEGDAAGAAVVEFDRGVVASWRGSWVSPAPSTNWAGEWHMEFEQGEVIWTARGDGGTTAADRVTIRPTGGKERTLDLPAMPLNGRAGSLSAFAEAVQSGALPEPDISGRSNLVTLAMAQSAVGSAAEGRRFPLAGDK